MPRWGRPYGGGPRWACRRCGVARHRAGRARVLVRWHLGRGGDRTRGNGLGAHRRRSGARIRRRESRFGLLLVCVGFAWFLVDWATPGVDSSVLFTIGLALGSSCPPFVAHAALSSTGARITAWWERAALATAYAGAVLVLGVLPALFFDPVAEGCSTCPENRLLVTTDPAATDRLLSVGVHLGLAWALVLVGVLAWRLVRATSAARRITAPLITAASVYLALVAATFATSLDSGFVTNDELSQRLWLGEAVALGLLSGLVAWGWLRGRRTRSTVAQLVVELAQSPAPGGLRDVLADTLDDPGLVLAYPVADGRFVDASGRPVDLDEAERERTPIVSDGGTVSVLSHRPDLLDDPEVVAADRRGGATHARERTPPGREQGPDRRPPRIARPDRRGRGRRAPAAGAGPPRRRSAAARRRSCSRSGCCGRGSARRRGSGSTARRPSSAARSTTCARSRTGSSLRYSRMRGSRERSRPLPRTRDTDRSRTLPERRFAPAVESAAYFVVAETARAATGAD